MKPRHAAAILRGGVGVGLLVLTLWLVDTREVLERLRHLRMGWVALGVALGPMQLALAAWRWCYTAHALGLPLRFKHALREYALSTFLNQVLPLGWLGDAARVTRYGRQHEAGRAVGVAPALRAVLIERASGQLVLALTVLVALPLWAERVRWPRLGQVSQNLALGVIACVGLGATIAIPRLRSAPVVGALTLLWGDARAALLSRRRLAAQLALSSLLLCTIVLQIMCALQALDLRLSSVAAAQIVPFMLLSMTVPASLAGFGPREAGTAALYRGAGLPPEHGAALALTYGVLVLLSGCVGLTLLHLRES